MDYSKVDDIKELKSLRDDEFMKQISLAQQAQEIQRQLNDSGIVVEEITARIEQLSKK